MMMKSIAFLSAAVVATVTPIATAYNPNISSANTRPAFSRRHLLQRTALISGSAVLAPLTQFAAPSLAKPADDIALIKSTCDQYKSVLSDKAAFVAALSAEDSTATIPPQIPAITFQDLAKVAHDVKSEGDNKLDADDFPFVAVEYAEHAGAARDFVKLSKLGRIGENGSPEVAAVYAEKCVVELEEAAVLLDVLRQAVE